MPTSRLLLCCTFLWSCRLTQAADLAFRQETVTSDLEGGYQVVVADLNHDGKPDLIALASGMKELVWFESPSRLRHVIVRDRSQMINLAAADLDDDGIPEIVLAEQFAMDPRQSAGVLSLLRHQGDPRGLWSVKEIDRLPATHRLRWADIDGSGNRVLVNAPLAGPDAAPPDFKAKVSPVYYRPGAWKRETIPDALAGVLHGIFITDFDGDGRDEILTASFLGIHLFKFEKAGTWRRTEIGRGEPAPWPKSGASDVAVGRLGARKFICSIEPWHGNQVAVYFEEDGAWRRRVIDDQLLDAHTISAADLDGDGRDEIISGYRGKGRSVYIYRANASGNRWSRTALDDGGMGAASCAVADLDGDGRPDIACIDDHQLKVYRNVTSR
jgi:FG-GAP-like repeat/FG-GAP repeat